MVHAFRIHGLNIAFDNNVNALHILDDLSFALLEAHINSGAGAFAGAWPAEGAALKYGPDEILEASRELSALVESGQLLTPDLEEPNNPATPDLEEPKNPATPEYALKSLCMHMAHDCNMRCAYCFASDGGYGQKRELMSFETAKAAIDFVAGASGARKNIEIDFFGGEPLLNFDVIKRVVEYARSIETAKGKRFRFTLTTNGLLLDDKTADYVNENMDNLVLSIDGRKETHDGLRRRPGGAGTYGAVVENFLSATRKRSKSWYARGTFTARNMDFTKDALHLADIGLDRISLEPVVSPADPALDFEPGAQKIIEAEYEKLAYDMFVRESGGHENGGRPFAFFHFDVDLDSGPCLARRIKGCGAGYEYAAVTPDGSLYPCHQFAGERRFRIGDVYGGVDAPETVRSFINTSIYTKDECRVCWAKYFCGGGCAANAWHYNKDIARPNPFYCALFKKRIECALWLKCAAAQPGPDGPVS